MCPDLSSKEGEKGKREEGKKDGRMVGKKVSKQVGKSRLRKQIPEVIVSNFN